MKTARHETVAVADPRFLSAVQLARLGVQIQNRYNLLLQCVTCGHTWSPERARDGGLVEGYWICPNKCNV